MLKIISILLSFSLTLAGRILFFPGHDGASHTKSMYPAAEALHRAGHQVYTVQLIHDPVNACKNKAGVVDRVIYTIRDRNEIPSEGSSTVPSSVLWTKSTTGAISLIFPWKATTDACLKILSEPTSRTEFYEVLNGSWDAVFVDTLFAACGLYAVQKRLTGNDTLLVEFSTTLFFPDTIEQRGAWTPPSVSASIDQPFYTPSHFFYRLGTALGLFKLRCILIVLDFLMPYWGRDLDFGGVAPSVVFRESSLALTAYPSALDFSQPWTMDLGEIDGACSTDTALPEPFSTFVNTPHNRGTILFAMGHYSDWNYAPAGAMDAFVQAFARLPQYRIIWQVNAKSVKPVRVSSNVLIETWVPQSAILNHPNTKVFISHMGLKSMREAVCGKVPVVAMPMFAEQSRNTALAQKRGFAVYLDKTKLTVDTVLDALKRILDDDQYGRAVQRVQEQLNDRIRDTASLVAFQLDFFMRRSKTGFLDKYVRTKWKHLSILTRWWQLEFVVPVLVVLISAVRLIV